MIRYRVPLGKCDVEIVIRGKGITRHTFDILNEWIETFKRVKKWPVPESNDDSTESMQQK